ASCSSVVHKGCTKPHWANEKLTVCKPCIREHGPRPSNKRPRVEAGEGHLSQRRLKVIGDKQDVVLPRRGGDVAVEAFAWSVTSGKLGGLIPKLFLIFLI
ncbi:unnamed protein product, partial [Discosporangium mesarthrocarpum]